MNRLILIGNGFDIAHGLKTRYSDFIKFYLSGVVNEFYLNNSYEDLLISIKFRNHGGCFTQTVEPSTSENVMDRIIVLRNSPTFEYRVKSSFLSSTLMNLQKYNWVDIENEYFTELLSYRSTNLTKKTHKFDNTKIKLLNDEFEYLKQHFINYLNIICWQDDDTTYTDYIKLFTEPIRDIDLMTPTGVNSPPLNITILSFNYTPTALHYQKECEKIIPSTKVNYIHGKLKEIGNPIIFGFGDEYDKNYLDFEDVKNNQLFTHVKSFGYLKTSNYHNLMKFLEHYDYQVYVFGHSLGLSDRTMLKKIFEHENCQSIKIFYHRHNDGTDDYTEKTYEASRHFTDKGVMREKIVSHDRSEKMPQCTSL